MLDPVLSPSTELAGFRTNYANKMPHGIKKGIGPAGGEGAQGARSLTHRNVINDKNVTK